MLETIALIISGFGFILALIAFFYEKRLWNKMNLGRISVTEVDYITFRKLEWNEVATNDWGYNLPILTNPGETDYNPNFANLKSRLIAKDSAGNQFETYSLTLNELRKELTTKNHTDINNYHYGYRFQPIITIQNTGLTPCFVEGIVIEDFNIENYNLDGDASTTILPHQKFSLDSTQLKKLSSYHFFIPLNNPIPNVSFKLSVTYSTVKSKNVIRKFSVMGGQSDFKISLVENKKIPKKPF